MEEERYTRITLRIPRDLHEKLQYEADVSSKSMNAEIVARLQESFLQRKSLSSDDMIIADLINDKEVLRAVVEQQELMIKNLVSLLKTTIQSKNIPSEMIGTELQQILNGINILEQKTGIWRSLINQKLISDI